MKNSLLLLVIILLAGCGVKPAPHPELDNTPIPFKFGKDSTITLQDGTYSEAAAPDSTSKTTINTTEYFAKGTIDGQQILAAILTTNSGTAGTFYSLFLFIEENNILSYADQTQLGDRVQINRIGITDNMIKVSLSSRTPETDMAAEPDLPLIKSFVIRGQKLKEPGHPEATPTVKKPPPPTFAGKTFYWQSSLYGNDTQETPKIPAKYSITFNNDWTINIQSDCIKTGGFFGMKGSQITIRPDLPVENCNSHSLSPVFLRDLNDAVIFLFQDKNLYIDLIYDSGTLILTKQP